jgi:zinc/manganese transport system permease protein
MVVTPSATAVAITARPHVAIALSTAISTACVWIGLTLSAMFNLPPSFFIVSLAFSVWLITILVLRTPRARSANAASLRPNRRANPVP